MVAFSSMSESKYLKKEDLDEQGNLCTIKAFKKQNVAQEGEDPENKYVMYTHEFEKGLVLNATNRAILERVYGPDTDDCIGNPIVLYVDENVSYAGKIVGGIRLRAPKGHAKPKVAPGAKAQGVDTDDIPF